MGFPWDSRVLGWARPGLLVVSRAAVLEASRNRVLADLCVLGRALLEAFFGHSRHLAAP